MSDRGWPLLSSVKLEAKFIAKILALSNMDEITSGAFMMESTGSLSLLRILFEIF